MVSSCCCCCCEVNGKTCVSLSTPLRDETSNCQTRRTQQLHEVCNYSVNVEQLHIHISLNNQRLSHALVLSICLTRSAQSGSHCERRNNRQTGRKKKKKREKNRHTYRDFFVELLTTFFIMCIQL